MILPPIHYWILYVPVYIESSCLKSIYSRISRKRSPKMSSGAGRLREVVAYESLDYNDPSIMD